MINYKTLLSLWGLKKIKQIHNLSLISIIDSNSYTKLFPMIANDFNNNEKKTNEG